MMVEAIADGGIGGRCLRVSARSITPSLRENKTKHTENSYWKSWLHLAQIFLTLVSD